NADGSMEFRQNSDLFYLSGIDQEETILVICPEARDERFREILFIKETSELIAVWEGAKLTKDQAFAASGIKTIYWRHEFEKIIRALILQAQHVYLNYNEHARKYIE